MTRDWQTYVGGFILYFATIASTYLLNAFEEKPLDLIHITMIAVRTVAGFAANFDPKRTLLRIFYGQFLITPFWLTQIFLAYWVIFSPQILYEKQIDTLNEIA